MSVPRPAMLVAMVIVFRPPGLGDDLGLARVLLGVEDLVRQSLRLQQVRKHLGVLDRGRAHQHRLAALVAVLDVGQDGGVLLAHRAVDLVLLVETHHGLVRRDHHRFQPVDLLEFVSLGVRRAVMPASLPYMRK